MYTYIYIYIYIERERERLMYMHCAPGSRARLGARFWPQGYIYIYNI